jgi:putative SOS response-associated peptidase YedK
LDHELKKLMASTNGLMRPFPAQLMRMWPASTSVNKRENHDPSILEPVEVAPDAA